MKEIMCPTCKKPTVYDTSNESRPFCSERCQLIDLGEWAEGNYAIASEQPPTEEEFEEILSTDPSKSKH